MLIAYVIGALVAAALAIVVAWIVEERRDYPLIFAIGVLWPAAIVAIAVAGLVAVFLAITEKVGAWRRDRQRRRRPALIDAIDQKPIAKIVFAPGHSLGVHPGAPFGKACRDCRLAAIDAVGPR